MSQKPSSLHDPSNKGDIIPPNVERLSFEVDQNILVNKIASKNSNTADVPLVDAHVL